LNTKQAYKQKMEAELELAQAKLAEFKAQAKSAAADTQFEHVKQVDELEEKVGDTKAKLHELAAASDDVWGKFKDGVESSWKSLSVAVRNTAAKFKV
jgi:hypothetical protein